MLRPCVVDGVDDAEDSRKEDDDEKREEDSVDDMVDLAGKMDEAVAVGEPCEQEEQGNVHGQPMDEFAQPFRELRRASADDMAKTQQNHDGEKDGDHGADAASDKLRLVGFKPVADFRGIGCQRGDGALDAFAFHGRRRGGTQDRRRVLLRFFLWRGFCRRLCRLLQRLCFYGIRCIRHFSVK